MSAAEFTDPVMFVAEGYEYNIQYRYKDGHPVSGDRKWHYNWTNKFSADIWYPRLKSVNAALAQMKGTRYGYNRYSDREFRVVRRSIGGVEVL